MGFRAFQIEDADQAILHQERNDQFGANGDAGIDLAAQKARIRKSVSDAHGAACTGGGAGKALVQGNAHTRGNGIAIAHDESAFEMLRFFIPQHDGENVIVDEFFDALSDLAKQLFAVEDGSDFAADFVEQRESVGLLGVRNEQTRRNGVGVADEGKRSKLGSFIHGPGPSSLERYSLDVPSVSTLRQSAEH